MNREERFSDYFRLVNNHVNSVLGEIALGNIAKEIKHGLTEDQLEKRMRELVFTDMIARGTTN